jgi:UDP-N-acetylmuramoyl-L-alanyl-D-glutamate--2,6-diaminopimelate ligase
LKLSAITAQLPGVIKGPVSDPEITGVACDSRQVQRGSLFAAISGERTDGHNFLQNAAERGAAACIVEREDADTFGMARILVEDPEEALGWAASAFFGHPSRSLTLVGITGTNGKTTTAHLIQHILREAGISAGRMGTVGNSYPSGAEENSPLTTPDAPALQAILARMVREGAQAVVAEISSHALMRKRTAGCSFACTVFTNLTQDHLDFHGSMEEYFQAKKMLFTDYPRLVEAVVNVDDPWGRMLASELGGHVVTFGLESGDIRFEATSYEAGGIKGTIVYPGGEERISLPLTGAFNAQNSSAALGVAWALGLDFKKAVRALENAPQTPGRLEKVENSLGIGVYVDYAHTPDALARVLESVRPLTRGRLFCVFGCGGDRDKAKRPLMAKAAAEWADIVVLTADNSRSEETSLILDSIESGIPPDWRKVSSGDLLSGCREYARIEDREEAIGWAVKAAVPGDIVIVAGKGHETYQIFRDRTDRFDDREKALDFLSQRGSL